MNCKSPGQSGAKEGRRGQGKRTLARKFDSVQRKTVTRRRQMPSVRLAIPPSPILAQNPTCFVSDGDEVFAACEPVDVAISTAASLSIDADNLGWLV
jgi:hypothetical protein